MWRVCSQEYHLEVMRRLREAIRKNARICGKTILGCSHIVAYPWFFGQKQHTNRVSAIVFTGLGLLRLFPVPKTQKTHERTEIYHDQGDYGKTASLEELKVIPKSAYQKCFEDWKKRWLTCIISKRTLRGQNRYWWINKYFSRKKNLPFYLNTPRIPYIDNKE